ncbi:MAG: phosphoglycerate kinase [Bifidobacteriaceae bacterium]|jgi:phosphoglycerate kinase|nr:phosphoglycerate kinase [Bifidobacteriaceae bacterium]
MKTISDLGNLAGQRVLVRCDLNVPLDGQTITDDGRIRASLPTIELLRAAGAKVVVMAHLGRPKGVPEDRYSLAPVAVRLGELLGAPVAFAKDTVGVLAHQMVGSLANGSVGLLENLRFNPGETAKDDAERAAFAKLLAQLGDAYVSDGFGVVHRKQASVYDIAKLLPSAVGGLVLAEVEALRRATDNPQRPYVVILGGSKVSDKLGVIAHLLDKADRLLIGGGMTYTFLAAQGHQVGTSLLEEDQIAAVQQYLATAQQRGVEIVLPVDVLAASEFSPTADHQVVPTNAIPADRMGLDIGPATRQLFRSKILDARTVVWNGPMGVFEFAAFSGGTLAVAQAMVDSPAFTIVGGGDSAAAVRQLDVDETGFSHISTGGGASLEFLEGKTLPGVAVLEDQA